MKTKEHYIQKAREAAWILNHIAEADRKFVSGDPVLQHQGAAEREKWLGKWLKWKQANPEEAVMAQKLMNQDQIKKIKEREQNDEMRSRIKSMKTSWQDTEEDKRKIEQDLQGIPKALDQMTQEVVHRGNENGSDSDR